jgi:hypothetical protein
MGRLDVRIVEARNLPNTETFGQPDPYVVVTLDNTQHKTSVASSTLNPKWDEVFKFVLADPDSAQLELKLWDKNMISDAFMGQYRMSVAGLTKGIVKDVTCLLQQCKTNAEIRIRLLAHDFGRDPTPAEAAAAGLAAPAGAAPAPAPAPAPRPAAPQVVYQQPAPQQVVYQQPAPQVVYQAPPVVVQQPVFQQPVYQAPPPQQPAFQFGQPQPQPGFQFGQPQQQAGFGAGAMMGAMAGMMGAMGAALGGAMGGQAGGTQSWSDGQTVQFGGRVVRATYGPFGSNNDVTFAVQQLQNQGRNQIFGGIHTAIGDPFPGVPKQFTVWYG